MAKGICDYCGKEDKVEMRFGNKFCMSCFEHVSNYKAHKESSIEYFKSVDTSKATEDALKYVQTHIDFVDEKEQTEKAYAEAMLQVQAELKRIMSSFKITSGNGFEGYHITDYLNMVHAESSAGTGLISELSLSIADFIGGSSNIYESKLSKAKHEAEQIMMYKAAQKGANAIIGIDYDIMTLGNNMIIVSANGTAVKIEKIG